MTLTEPLSMIKLNYKKWNEALCKYFFCEANRHKVVYLYVNDNLIKEIGLDLGLIKDEAINSFCNSVKAYCYDVHLVFKKAYDEGKQWNERGRNGYPPFVAVLAITVLASTKMETDEKKSSLDYYSRLRNLLDINDKGGMPDYFDKTINLWQYLKSWQEDNEGEYGYTNVFPYGHKYIGYPKSQCLIKDSERKLLYDFFKWANFQPGMKIEKTRIGQHLRIFLANKYNRLSRLYINENEDLKEAMIDIIIGEFNLWNKGEKTNNSKFNYEKKTRNLKCIELDLHLKIIKHGLLTSAIQLSYLAVLEEEPFFTLEEEIKMGQFYYKNMSFRREYLQNDDLLHEYSFDYSKYGVKLRFKGSWIFAFRKGSDLGVEGWVSRTDIIPGYEHILLYHSNYERNIRKWIEDNKISIHKKEYKYIPNGWRLLVLNIDDKASDIVNSNIVVNHEKISINFSGGLKVGNQEWLLDAPPIMSVVAPKKSVVKLNDNPILSLIDDSAVIDCNQLDLNKSEVYKFSVENYSKSIFLRNDHLVKFDADTLKYKTISIDSLEVRVIGNYIDNDLNNIPTTYKLKNTGEVILTAGEKSTELKIPKEKDKPPFVRAYTDIELDYIDEKEFKPRAIDLFYEYLSICSEGNWNEFLRGLKWCFHEGNLNLIAYKVRRKLSQLGFVEFTGEGDNNRYSWRVTPTSATILPSRDYIACLTGARTRKLVGNLIESSYGKVKFLWSYPKNEPEFEPMSIYILAPNRDELDQYLRAQNIYFNLDDNYFAYDLAMCIPSIGEIVRSCIETVQPFGDNWELRMWDVLESSWKEQGVSTLKQYSSKFGTFFCLLDIGRHNPVKVDRDVGKVYLAAQKKIHIFSYDNYNLKIKKQYFLPELYERVLASCIGQSSIEVGRFRIYRNVPSEVALLVAFKMGFDLKF